MSQPIDPHKVVIFSGAGISAESGLATFRDNDGLWNRYNISEVATPTAWESNPELVLQFYNERRSQIVAAVPNLAHVAIAELESKYEVVVITQNIDDLHERAGSSRIIHVHGEITKARSSIDPTSIYDIGGKAIHLGDTCDRGSQLRPQIVWFGEEIQNFDLAKQELKTASKVLVVGTSLTVYPAASLLKKARFHAEKIIISLEIETKPFGYTCWRASAADAVPLVVQRWLQQADRKWASHSSMSQ
jgi:NAD-dependent deacetylase